MIYLTFDTNIWIYTLDDSWRIENLLDYIEPWILDNQVKLLLPQIVLDEWVSKRENQVAEREQKLSEFFMMAEEILPSAFFSDYKKTETQKLIISNQLERIENILNTAEIIPINEDIRNKVLEWGIKRYAPMQKKSSIPDTIIILSLFDFASKNREHSYFFISNDLDGFYHKENKKAIHQDLAPYFEQYNIKLFKQLKHLVYYLKETNAIRIDYNVEQKRKERIKNKLKEKIYNPEYEKITATQESSFIINLGTLDYILKESKPSKEQVLFVLALIDSDNSYEEKFYEWLKSSSWFKILKSKGVFDPQNNPIPIQSKEGSHRWCVLIYLEMLSNQVKEGKNESLIDEIVAVIKNICEQPRDNEWTWHSLITILSNLPNDRIPNEILNYVPLWCKGRLGSSLGGFALCEKLLPKFLVDEPTSDDIEKTKIILQHLFTVDKAEPAKGEVLRESPSSYIAKVDLHALAKIVITKNLLANIALHCSNDLVFRLAENIKKLRFDFPHGINISLKLSDQDLNITIQIEGKDLMIAMPELKKPDAIIDSLIISDFENYDEKQTKDALVAILKKREIDYIATEQNEFQLNLFLNAVRNGSFHPIRNPAISKLKDKFQHSDNVREVFPLIFVELLNEIVKQRPDQGLDLLNMLASDNYYRLPFFRRTMLYVIGENWKKSKHIFWKYVENIDSESFFSNPNYQNELFELLSNNQNSLTTDETKLLCAIIDKGPQDEHAQNPKYANRWKLRWYSALKNIAAFKSDYEKLSLLMNLTYEEFEDDDDKIAVMRGSISPITVEQILHLTNAEIVEYIHNFLPQDNWGEPSIDGLAEVLEKAIIADPQKFSNQIDLYHNVGYIYAYRICHGFEQAWKSSKKFNWERLLDFIKDYITAPGFYSDSLKTPYHGYGATSDWVAGSVSYLLTAGMQTDANSFTIDLLPKAKEILQSLATNLKSKEDIKSTNMDYPTYSLNSTAGKVLRATLDYSLRKVRTQKAMGLVPIWEDDIKTLFDETITKGIIDGYILLGWYFPQFQYLDKDWLSTKIIESSSINQREWTAFLGGLAFTNPPQTKAMYNLFYPHYERAILNRVELKSFYDAGLVRHFVSFYFWGFENLKKEGLLLLFLNNSKADAIQELVNFIWRQEAYYKNLKGDNIRKFEEMILALWQFLTEKYQSASEQEELKIVAQLANFLEFAPQLNATYTSLILKSVQTKVKSHYMYRIIDNLTFLKSKGVSLETAKYLGQILSAIPFNEYFATADKEHLIDLVRFLYENEQKSVADNFCNTMTQKYRHEFLIEIYNEYKE